MECSSLSAQPYMLICWNPTLLVKSILGCLLWSLWPERFYFTHIGLLSSSLGNWSCTALCFEYLYFSLLLRVNFSLFFLIVFVVSLYMCLCCMGACVSVLVSGIFLDCSSTLFSLGRVGSLKLKLADITSLTSQLVPGISRLPKLQLCPPNIYVCSENVNSGPFACKTSCDCWAIFAFWVRVFRLSSTLQFSCLSFLSVVIIGVYHPNGL